MFSFSTYPNTSGAATASVAIMYPHKQSWHLTIQSTANCHWTHECSSFPLFLCGTGSYAAQATLYVTKDVLKLLLIFCLYLPNARINNVIPSLLQICFSFSVALSGFSFVLKAPRATQQLLNRDLVSNAVSDAAFPSCLAKWMNLVFPFFDPPFKTKFPNHVSSQLLHAHSLREA